MLLTLLEIGKNILACMVDPVERSVGGAKDQSCRNHGGVVVAAVATACSGS